MSRNLDYRFSTILLVTIFAVTSLGSANPIFPQITKPDNQVVSFETDGAPLYFPIVMNLSDFTVDFLEITQAVQTSTNSVTLVANRQTVARVYTRTSGMNPITGVYVSISAFRGGSELPGSPLMVGPGTVPASWSRADINSSFNRILPTDWLSGNVNLIATVNPGDVMPEKDYTNNSLTKAVSFTSVPSLNLTVVPIIYKHTPNGKTYPAAGSSFIEGAFERFYPVSSTNVTIHNSYYFQGNLDNTSSWNSLLYLITDLKQLEGAPASRVYYGMIPLLDSNGYSWWDGGYAGLGWVGNRISIGLTDAYLMEYHYYVNGKDIASHEVGHNLGRYHSPCGDPSNIDPNYPYPGGVTGQYGFDITAWQVIPPTYYDIMGYCDPNWISDYTYLGLLQNQLVFGALEVEPAPMESLYIRADLAEDGSATLLPIYALSSYSEAPSESSEYSLEFLNSDGKVVAVHPLAVSLALGKDFQVRTIRLSIPKPALPFSNVRLTRNGVLTSERSVAQDLRLKIAQPMAQLDNGDLLLQWGTPQTPAMVRYTTDNGNSWTVLGFDIIDGELRIDPQSLPMGSLLFQITLADTQESTSSVTWEHTP